MNQTSIHVGLVVLTWNFIMVYYNDMRYDVKVLSFPLTWTTNPNESTIWVVKTEIEMNIILHKYHCSYND